MRLYGGRKLWDSPHYDSILLKLLAAQQIWLWTVRTEEVKEGQRQTREKHKDLCKWLEESLL